MYRELSRAARLFAAGLIILFLCLMTLWACGMATAQEKQGWWDHPRVRACCAVSDAVYADEWRVMPDGSVLARVTGGGPRDHAWAPIGREYHIPAERVVDVPGNPTGRALLFLAPHSLNLYCFALGPLT